MDRRRPRIGIFTGYSFTGYEFTGYPFTGRQFGEDEDAVDFAMFWNGEPTYYTTYTRLDIAYAESRDGDVVEVPQDSPAFEYVATGGITNLVLINGVPIDGDYTGLTVVGATATLSQEVLGDGLRYYKLEAGGSSAYVEFDGPTGTTSDCMFSIWGVCSNFTGAFLASSDGNIVDLPTGTPERKSGVVSPSGTGVKMRIEAGSLTTTHFRLPQITVGTDLEIDVPALPTGPITEGGVITKRFRQYYGTGTLPFPPATSVAVNAGTTALLAEDIDTACFKLDSAQSDNIELDSAICICDGDYIEFNTVTPSSLNNYNVFSNQPFFSRIAFDTTGRLLVESDIDNNQVVFSYITSVNTEYKIKILRNGDNHLLYINDVLEDTKTMPVSADTTLKYFSNNTAVFYDGYLWGVSYFDSSENKTYEWNLSEYREDTFVRESNYGNHGTASRAVNLLLSENDAFGYPVNEIARTPWQYTTADGDVIQKGLKEFFLGQADGALLATGNLVAANRYKVITTETDHFGVGVVAGDIVTGLTTALDANNTVRQVSNAVGVVPFTAYIPHALTADMPLIQFQDSDFVPLYVEVTTGLIKGYDGTNKCQSASACVAGTEVSGWFAFNGDEMWITLDGTKGTITTFAGYFPDIGNRVFGMTDGTYQTIRHLYFENELFFEYVFHDGEQVFHNGEPVIVYT